VANFKAPCEAQRLLIFEKMEDHLARRRATPHWDIPSEKMIFIESVSHHQMNQLAASFAKGVVTCGPQELGMDARGTRKGEREPLSLCMPYRMLAQGECISPVTLKVHDEIPLAHSG